MVGNHDQPSIALNCIFLNWEASCNWKSPGGLRAFHSGPESERGYEFKVFKSFEHHKRDGVDPERDQGSERRTSLSALLLNVVLFLTNITQLIRCTFFYKQASAAARQAVHNSARTAVLVHHHYYYYYYGEEAEHTQRYA